jgi:hypothetical protein
MDKLIAELRFCIVELKHDFSAFWETGYIQGLSSALYPQVETTVAEDL